MARTLTTLTNLSDDEDEDDILAIRRLEEDIQWKCLLLEEKLRADHMKRMSHLEERLEKLAIQCLEVESGHAKEKSKLQGLVASLPGKIKTAKNEWKARIRKMNDAHLTKMTKLQAGLSGLRKRGAAAGERLSLEDGRVDAALVALEDASGRRQREGRLLLAKLGHLKGLAQQQRREISSATESAGRDAAEKGSVLEEAVCKLRADLLRAKVQREQRERDSENKVADLRNSLENLEVTVKHLPKPETLGRHLKWEINELKLACSNGRVILDRTAFDAHRRLEQTAGKGRADLRRQLRGLHEEMRKVSALLAGADARLESLRQEGRERAAAHHLEVRRRKEAVERDLEKHGDRLQAGREEHRENLSRLEKLELQKEEELLQTRQRTEDAIEAAKKKLQDLTDCYMVDISGREEAMESVRQVMRDKEEKHLKEILGYLVPIQKCALEWESTIDMLHFLREESESEARVIVERGKVMQRRYSVQQDDLSVEITSLTNRIREAEDKESAEGIEVAVKTATQKLRKSVQSMCSDKEQIVLEVARYQETVPQVLQWFLMLKGIQSMVEEESKVLSDGSERVKGRIESENLQHKYEVESLKGRICQALSKRQNSTLAHEKECKTLFKIFCSMSMEENNGKVIESIEHSLQRKVQEATEALNDVQDCETARKRDHKQDLEKITSEYRNEIGVLKKHDLNQVEHCANLLRTCGAGINSSVLSSDTDCVTSSYLSFPESQEKLKKKNRRLQRKIDVLETKTQELNSLPSCTTFTRGDFSSDFFNSGTVQDDDNVVFLLQKTKALWAENCALRDYRDRLLQKAFSKCPSSIQLHEA